MGPFEGKNLEEGKKNEVSMLMRGLNETEGERI